MAIYLSNTRNICCYIICQFVDKLSIRDTISSHMITEVSVILFKHFLFSQKHVLEFQP